VNLNVHPLVFVHIPKTAGTSFRMSLEKTLGIDQICMDYGAEYGGTSPCILEWFKSRDSYRLYEMFNQKGFRVLAGHFGVARYVNLFPTQSMVTFLRDPVKRVLSEYSHFRRNHAYKGTLEEFCSWDRNKNMQTRMLANVPRTALGLVGITERYEDSLALFTHRFGLQLPIIQENTDPDRVANEVKINEEKRKQIELFNREDSILYHRAVQDFDVQIEMMKVNKPYTFAHFQISDANRLNGWAFQRDNDLPITLRIILNGKEHKTLEAKDYNAGLHRFGCPRKGHLGFNLELPKLKKEDHIQCQVVETGQLFAVDIGNV
jgi:hypothetical protein